MQTALPKPSSLDPRWFQIGTLATLLSVIMIYSPFSFRLSAVVLIIVTALVTQYVFARICKLDHTAIIQSMLSAGITSLSLNLLFRADDLYLFPLAAFLAIASKFIIRVRGKHIFNPANFGIVSLLLLMPDDVWVSPGQWGRDGWVVSLLVIGAMVVLTQARRMDTALSFWGSYAALLFGRALYLGAPLTIPWHNLQNGALLIFTFFMITDPRATPDHPYARILFGGMVALVTCYLQFFMYVQTAPFYALAMMSLLVPLLDLVFRHDRHRWKTQNSSNL